MGIPTVLMVGAEHLSSVTDYLRLHSVVVIAPSQLTLDRWWDERSDPPPRPSTTNPGLAVDPAGRRVRWRGEPIPLTDLEFRVASCLAGEPGTAWSYRDLREAGWGRGPHLAIDDVAVRSVIQRIRRKLHQAGAAVRIDAVRGFGFRLELA
jgi:DNA-binding response OmpR family regulator